MFDVPWDVRWNKSFEETVDQLKSSGRFDNYRGTIEDIIEYPVREGKYKEGSLKGFRTTHVEDDIVCWEVTPGVNDVSLQHKVEEVYFHFIDDHDDMETAVSGKDPAKKSSEFEVLLPYMEGFVVERKLDEIYTAATKVDGFAVDGCDWESESVSVTGVIPPDDREELENLLPDAAEVDYDDPSLF
jgi:hypothetical protein